MIISNVWKSIHNEDNILVDVQIFYGAFFNCD